MCSPHEKYVYSVLRKAKASRKSNNSQEQIYPTEGKCRRLTTILFSRVPKRGRRMISLVKEKEEEEEKREEKNNDESRSFFFSRALPSHSFLRLNT